MTKRMPTILFVAGVATAARPLAGARLTLPGQSRPCEARSTTSVFEPLTVDALPAASIAVTVNA